MDTLEAIHARRSVGRLAEPAPSDDELRQILEAGTAAPDHGELKPWKFVVLRGEEKDGFGQVLEDAYVARCRAIGAQPTDGQLRKERTKLGRAPLVVIACAVNQHSEEIPWIEQILAVGAAVENMLLAATALGYGSRWRTGPPAYDHRVMHALGLGEHDAIVGFVYLGTPARGAPV
jgi:nitroreductase